MRSQKEEGGVTQRSVWCLLRHASCGTVGQREEVEVPELRGWGTCGGCRCSGFFGESWRKGGACSWGRRGEIPRPLPFSRLPLSHWYMPLAKPRQKPAAQRLRNATSGSALCEQTVSGSRQGMGPRMNTQAQDWAAYHALAINSLTNSLIKKLFIQHLSCARQGARH